MLNTYLGIDGKTYVTAATAVHQIYLPIRDRLREVSICQVGFQAQIR